MPSAWPPTEAVASRVPAFPACADSATPPATSSTATSTGFGQSAPPIVRHAIQAAPSGRTTVWTASQA